MVCVSNPIRTSPQTWHDHLIDLEDFSMQLSTRSTVVGMTISLSLSLGAVTTQPALASKSGSCGSYQVLGQSGSSAFDGAVPAPSGVFHVQGTYTQFDVRSSDFAVFNYAFTGAANPQDITGGRFTPVYESKIPDHRGLVLTSDIGLNVGGADLVLSRTGTGGLSMKIQAKDCAQGGIFQMEPARGDNARTRIVHRLAGSDPTSATTAFYFDNANFRSQLGQFLGADCQNPQTGPPSTYCVQVTPRVNIGNGLSADFVVRDSAQVATRIPQAECGPDFTNALGLSETKDYCGGMTIWDVASGGRMGMVAGGDGTEVANPPAACVSNCQAQDQVRGRLAVLGFPFPVPASSQLAPRYSGDGLTAPLTPPFTGGAAATGAGSGASTTLSAPPTASSGAGATPATPRGEFTVAGLAGKAPRLWLSISAGRSAPGLASVALKLPRGVSVNAHRLTRGLSIRLDRRSLRPGSARRKGVLRFSFGGRERAVVIAFAGSALDVSHDLQNRVRHDRASGLTLMATVRDASGRMTTLELQAQAR
jgi:hypothetical protein